MLYGWSHKSPGVGSLLVSAILSVIAGIALLLRPVSGAISITVMLIMIFALGGVAKLCYPLAFHNISRTTEAGFGRTA